MTQTQVRAVEVSLIGSAMPSGLALGPAGRLAALLAEEQSWAALCSLGICEAG